MYKINRQFSFVVIIICLSLFIPLISAQPPYNQLGYSLDFSQTGSAIDLNPSISSGNGTGGNNTYYNNTYINQSVNATVNSTQFDSSNPIHIDDSIGGWLRNFINSFGFLTTFTEVDPIYATENLTIARIGNCPSGQVVQNTTTSGVQCVTPTSVETEPLWTSNYTAFNSSWSSTYNSTYDAKISFNNSNLFYTNITNNVSVYQNFTNVSITTLKIPSIGSIVCSPSCESFCRNITALYYNSTAC